MSSTRSRGVHIPAVLIADISAFISAVWFDLGVPTSELRVEIAGELAQLYEVKVNEDGGSAAFIERLIYIIDTKMCENIANDVIDEKKSIHDVKNCPIGVKKMKLFGRRTSGMM